ncbi:MAG: Crp/Fnr family transcriptional regulator [Candidatus Acetothermia bacterium]|nr:Crp/Fnr family transcriptional regulator [Candidatus Bipolaricaulota bacterium]
MLKDKRFTSLKELFNYLASKEGATVSYQRGETIYKEGEPDNKVYWVDSGGIAQSQRISNGQNLTYQILLRNDIFSTYHLSSRVINQPCTAKALVNSTLKELLRDTFKEYLLSNPELSLEVIDKISDELQARDETLERQISMTAKERIHSILENLAPLGKKCGRGVSITFITRRELAEMAGMTEETATRSLSTLEGEGVLQKSRGEILLF